MDRSSVFYVVKVVVLFISLSVLFDRFIWTVLNITSDRVYSGQSVGKLNQYIRVKDSLDFVVFGSSRANHNVNPKILSNRGFNMGLNGKNIAYATALIELLPAGKKQTVLLHVDPTIMFQEKYLGDDLFDLSSKYYRNDIIKARMDRLKVRLPFKNIYKSISYNGKALAILGNSVRQGSVNYEYIGYDPLEMSSTQEEIFERIILNHPPIKYKKEYVLNWISSVCLDDMYRFCENNNKELILFTSPEYINYNKRDNQQMSNLLKNKGIKYFDFSDHFCENKSKKLWIDNIHLSALGSEIFSEDLKKVLKDGNIF